MGCTVHTMQSGILARVPCIIMHMAEIGTSVASHQLTIPFSARYDLHQTMHDAVA
jgi:hypothetical protein